MALECLEAGPDCRQWPYRPSAKVPSHTTTHELIVSKIVATQMRILLHICWTRVSHKTRTEESIVFLFHHLSFFACFVDRSQKGDNNSAPP
ncbi:hypothetical protein HBI56_232960 [Parastagonospora nodorum]|uniref:Uncharacterized protein n=1 Tax=Phaeosphaeria nodorum (strain SN15 / ATCC MYA-4574 / FGSC 10173) TaxID=321614 RepID=A0A7U2I3W1_PHANO|nr:hypothetical protein HBH56_200860 [Parastagonospora nodorum]QRD00814.1 hypothetical protein JI435_415830 [Parastagonospora nodorum SN15]KAH3925862.1 hypothetical protein HBH54_175430 [Parastagonospora nodorum]KAH3953024.1 hypothetical protein HBH53_036820 [Parastagonospora nodorum]KAH3976645.1 hypothetical protein HBH52_121850 [Parastagonospora nodorum]